jgi:sensor histidine kinase YesM
MMLWVIFLVNVIFQGLLWLDRHLDRRIPWYYFPRKRLVLEISIAFPSTLVILSLNYWVMFSLTSRAVSEEMLSHQRFIYTYIIMMIVMVVAVSIVIAGNFFRNWRGSLLEVEQLKQEKMKSDYQALQNQLNPHFLFNNFNMLVSEIRRDPANAVRITEKLSDVYRYVLESKNHETVALREELEFAESIIFLHRVRFDDHLTIDMNVSEECMDYGLPPLTLQILIENALKHNVVSSSQRLHIEIKTDKDYLWVSNTIQLRKSTYSTGLGLNNIKMRYSFLTDRQVIIETTGDRFMVKVPLLT